MPVTAIQITDFDEPNYNKKVVLVTARIHPGQSNSSHVCQGLIKHLCYDQRNVQFLKKIHFYIVPMLNPDGVIAGNYRTSLFGKDLNRTFKQSRKYAFPQTFHLVEYAKTLKKEHKQRFSTYLDLHGHSVKKNIFFYGPDYNIAHSFYNQCRQFARILGNLTTMFRYYSCIFRISGEKATTARATFNRIVNIPFTYTMQSSNGAFYDSLQHQQKSFIQNKWEQMGKFIVKGLEIWIDKQNLTPSSPTKSPRKKFIVQSSSENEDEGQKNQTKSEDEQDLTKKQPPGKQKQSDDDISQGKSDSQPQDQDLNDQQLEKLELEIQGKQKKEQKAQKTTIRQLSPEKSQRVKGKNEIFDWSNNLRKSQQNPPKKNMPSKSQRLPPINLQQNPIQFLSKNSDKRRMVISQALKNLSTDIKDDESKDPKVLKQIKQPKQTEPKKFKKSHQLSISELLIDQNEKKYHHESNGIIIKKKHSRQQFSQYTKRNW